MESTNFYKRLVFGIDNLKKHSRELSMAAMVAFLPAQPENVQVAEELNGKNWQEGSQIFFDQAQNGEGEIGGVYIQYEDGTQKWLSLGDGSGTNVYFHAMGSIKRIRENNSEGKKYELVCRAHTHSIDALRQVGEITSEQEKQIKNQQLHSPILSPSIEDLQSFYNFAGVVGKVIESSDSADFKDVVYTPTGAFYFEPVTEEYLQVNFPEVLSIREKAEEARVVALQILQNMKEGQAQKFEQTLQQNNHEIWQVFSDALDRDDLPKTSENIALLFFTNANNYFISRRLVDLLDSSEEQKQKIKEYVDYDDHTTPKGVYEIQLEFAKKSLQGPPREEDFNELYEKYAMAGWKLSYVSKEDLQQRAPCDSGMSGE